MATAAGGGDSRRSSRTGDELELQRALDHAKVVVSPCWSFPTARKVRALAVDRGDATRASSILVGSEAGRVHCLGVDGAEIWHHETGAWILGVGYLHQTPDAEPLAVVGSDDLNVLTLDGTLIEQVAHQSRVSSACIGSIHGRDAVITGHEDGSLRAYDPVRGTFWQARCPRKVIAVECCDVNLDGELEIAAASEDRGVHIFNLGGERIDRFQSNHWIISLAVGDVYNDGTRRLLVAGFDGSVYVYGGGKAAALRVRRRGVLSIAMGRLVSGSSNEQIVVGSSEQVVAVFDASGRELWRFDTTYGHRVVRILDSQPSPSLLVGSEDGFVHRVNLNIQTGLLDRIETLQGRAASLAPGPVQIRDESSTPVTVNAIRSLAAEGRLADASRTLVTLWARGAEENWRFRTQGRIYDVDVGAPAGTGSALVLAGSGDGTAYALEVDTGVPVWQFQADGPVRGVSWLRDPAGAVVGALVGSEDGSVYRLDANGRPRSHYQSADWVLKVLACPASHGEIGNRAWFGSEGAYVGGLSADGRLLCRVPAGDRSRALAVGDVDGDGHSEVVAGSDDRHVYVIDPVTGSVKCSFMVPHWILVTCAHDIDGDGRAEILVGTEDGNLYVHSGSGELRWSFSTGHWVAALAAGAGNRIWIGSADRYLYGVTRTGALQWRWLTSARVRTLADGGTVRGRSVVVYGSYDESVRAVSLAGAPELAQLASELAGALGDRTREALGEAAVVVAFAHGDRAAAIELWRNPGDTVSRSMAAAIGLCNGRLPAGFAFPLRELHLSSRPMPARTSSWRSYAASRTGGTTQTPTAGCSTRWERSRGPSSFSTGSACCPRSTHDFRNEIGLGCFR